MVTRRSLAELADSETSPLADKLRAHGVSYTSSGNLERGKGFVQAADIVDEDLRALSGRALVDALEAMLERRLEVFVADVVAAVRDAPAAPAVRLDETAAASSPARPARKPRARQPIESRVPRLVAEGRTDLPSVGLRRVLAAIAQHMPGGVDRPQLSILTGYKRSTRDLYVQRGIRAGWIAAGAHGRLVATDAGRAELGAAFVPLPTGRALLEHWLGRLPEGERRVLRFVAGFYPHAVSRDRITGETRYQRSTRDLYLQRLKRRHLIDVAGAGHVTAAAQLFDGPSGSKAAAT